MSQQKIEPRYIGIIAEWNPFHVGHASLLQTVKEIFPKTNIATIMSGNFVQRGEPAIFDKHIRAGWAIEAGCDVALEIPVRCVLQSADAFASFAARLAADISCDALAFGTESFNEDELLQCARVMLSEEFPMRLKQKLKTGIPYSRAVNLVIADCYPALSGGLSLPNNLLGIQYARAILQYRLPLRLIPIHRENNPALSASSIRKEILAGRIPNTLSKNVQDDISHLVSAGNITDYGRYEDACHLRSRLLDENKLSASGLFSEGLEHKWKKETNAETYPKMLSAIKSKRYLTSRLRRIGAALLLSDSVPSPFTATHPARYARLLALRKSESALLRLSRLPVVTSFAKALRTLSPEARSDLLLDARATDIAAWCRQNEESRKGGADYYVSPIIL